MPEIMTPQARRPVAIPPSFPLLRDENILLSNRAVKAIADDVLHSLVYSVVVAATDQPVASPSPVDTVFREFLASRSTTVRSAQRTKATALFKAPTVLRQQTLGRFAEVKPSDYAKSGHSGLAALAHPSRLDPRQLQDALRAVSQTALRLTLPSHHVETSKNGKVKLVVPPEVAAEARDHVEGAKFTKLGLFIKEVECLEDTDEFDSDEIELGGVFIDADGKATHLVAQFEVSSDFDPGESVIYPEPVFPGFDPAKLLTFVDDAYRKPGRKFAEWTIRRDLGWPTAYCAAMAMAEKDDKGFWRFLQELMKHVVAEVEKALKMGIGAAAGGAIGAEIGGVWGAIIGAAAGFIIGAIIDFLTMDNHDDILGTAHPVMKFGAATRSYYEWTGLLKQPHPDLFPINFTGDGGHYRVWCYYQVYA